MRCPFCGHENSQVKDSRPTEDGSSIRRRRQCEDCGARFTTFERVQLRELTIVKSENRREPFDRGKLERSIAIACRKRPSRRSGSSDSLPRSSASSRPVATARWPRAGSASW
jgi:transcriptional repressor NrdR